LYLLLHLNRTVSALLQRLHPSNDSLHLEELQQETKETAEAVES
jgi:hypothetical protein